jgi:hypothetical protein
MRSIDKWLRQRLRPDRQLTAHVMVEHLRRSRNRTLNSEAISGALPMRSATYHSMSTAMCAIPLTVPLLRWLIDTSLKSGDVRSIFGRARRAVESGRTFRGVDNNADDHVGPVASRCERGSTSPNVSRSVLMIEV